MNILLTNSTEFFSGGELFVLQLAKELKARGHKVVVSARPDHLLLKKCSEEKIIIEPIEFGKSIVYLKTVAALYSIIKKHSIDIVHSNSDFDRTYAGFASMLRRISHVASIHSEHSIRYNVVHWTRNKFAIDHFLVDGEPTKNILIDNDKIRPEKITILRLGIDVSELHKDDTLRSIIRKELKIPDDAIVIGNVARLVPFKGHAILIEAAAAVLKEKQNIVFIFIGDGELKTDLEKRAEHFGIASHIHFLGFQENLSQYYCAMDMYVHPSLDGGGESFPLAVLQAAASGLPIVASRVGDIPIMLNEEKNGYLALPGNREDLTAKLMKLIYNKEERIQKGENGSKFVWANYTTEKMTNAIEEVYHKVYSSRKRKTKHV